MVVTESEWQRTRGLIAEIGTGQRTYQIVGSLLAGCFVSFACLCLGLFSSADPVADWLWTVGITVSCCSGVLSAACFIFDRSLDKSRIEKRQSLVKDMDWLEARFEPAAYSAPSRKGRGAGNR